MTVEQIRRYMDTKPFRPFAVNLADARALFVEHPERLVLSNSGRTADIYGPFGVFETVDCLLVVSLRIISDMERRRPTSG